tara:strand:- start:125 stop:1144 length:1020 start_codon:yes stop_codon:yes gene_type:complete
MADFNKVNNKLDFRNVKQTQLDSAQTLKGSFSELQSALRTYGTNAILKEGYTHFFQQTNADGLPTYVEYWQASSPSTDKLSFRADNAGDLAGTYFTLQEYLTKRTHVFYFVVNGVGAAPGIGDIETPVLLANNDPASVVAYSTKLVLDSIDEFTVTHNSLLNAYLELEYIQFGQTAPIDVGTSGFLTTRITQGESFQVGEVYLDYDANGSVIYGGNVLKGLLYNPYTASFDVERDEISVTAIVSLDPVISKDPVIYNVNMTTAGVEYSQTLPIGTKGIKLNIRDHQGKYTVGWVSAGTVLTKSPGSTYEKEGLEIIVGKDVVYFIGTKDNIIMEIETWK